MGDDEYVSQMVYIPICDDEHVSTVVYLPDLFCRCIVLFVGTALSDEILLHLTMLSPK